MMTTEPTSIRESKPLSRDAVIDALRPEYQPIIDLASGRVVGFEALARWPGMPGATPDVVFDLARKEGWLAELDWACRLGAFSGALDRRLGSDRVLFVNVEPSSLGQPVPEHGRATIEAARTDLRVVLELTERALVERPADLLRLVNWARASGWGIALDDVGAEPASLALLPFLDPEVIKLDMALVRSRPTRDQAAIMAAVMAHSERTGATVLAEGIEDQHHLDQALALGATLGQGWMFGRAAPLPESSATVRSGSTPTVQLPSTRALERRTPFQIVEGHRLMRAGRKGLLLDLSLHIEQQGAHLDPGAVVLSAFQTADRYTPGTARRYEQLTKRCPLVAAFGCGLRPRDDSSVRFVDLDEGDPLAHEWTVTVIGPHYAGALIAMDMGDAGPDHDRRYEFVVTHDRDVVLAAARSLMTRIIAD